MIRNQGKPIKYFGHSHMLVQTNLLPFENLSLITDLREDDRKDRRPPDESRMKELLAQGNGLLARAASLLESAIGN